MEFSDFLLQITRPYWSPVHPTYYIQREGKHLVGWGLCYPEDIGAFNLMWLMSGAGGPPDDYVRYSREALWVCGYSNFPLGRLTLGIAAATMPIKRFSAFLDAHPQQTVLFEPLKDALRLKV